jgi:hypothetical protein
MLSKTFEQYFEDIDPDFKGINVITGEYLGTDEANDCIKFRLEWYTEGWRYHNKYVTISNKEFMDWCLYGNRVPITI